MDKGLKRLGEAIAKVEFGWPVGMPVCRSLEGERDLWEVRADISHGRIARIIFCIQRLYRSAARLHQEDSKDAGKRQKAGPKTHEGD